MVVFVCGMCHFDKRVSSLSLAFDVHTYKSFSLLKISLIKVLHREELKKNDAL
jgi:hypothetical protein